jgi:hypothetical protein
LFRRCWITVVIVFASTCSSASGRSGAGSTQTPDDVGVSSEFNNSPSMRSIFAIEVAEIVRRIEVEQHTNVASANDQIRESGRAPG